MYPAIISITMEEKVEWVEGEQPAGSATALEIRYEGRAGIKIY